MARSSAQQAAIAISMKKADKKPKSLTKAKKGISVKPTPDSTGYYKNEIKSYDQLIKSEPNTPIGKSNKLVYMDAKSKAYSNLNRQSLKGKPGYDKNGFPVKSGSGTTASTAAIQAATKYKNAKGGVVKNKKKNK